MDIYPEVKLLYHTLVLFLISWGIILFSIMAEPTYIPTNSVQGLAFLYIFTSTYLCFLYNSHTNKCEVIILLQFWFAFFWWLIMLMMIMLNIFSYTCWPFVCLLWKNVYFSSLLIFNWVVYFCYWGVEVPYIFWVLTSY